MNSADLKIRTNVFARNCVKFAAELPESKLGWHIQGQVIRCSTSVASNYHATCLAQSKKSYISKLGIVIEEADECDFWIEFNLDEKICDNELAKSLMAEAKELTAFFIASRKTAIKNLEQSNQ